jgi:hypothetical protein
MYCFPYEFTIASSVGDLYHDCIFSHEFMLSRDMLLLLALVPSANW